MKIVTLFALACIAYVMSSCANPNGTSKLDPVAEDLIYKAADVAVAEYERQHPVHREK